MIPIFLITKSAWECITREVEYFAAHPQGSKEAIVYPLFGFLRRSRCVKAPWEMLGIEDIEAFVVTHALAPLREYCNHTETHAGFSFPTPQDEHVFTEAVGSWSEALCARHPTLEIGNVHSHQFARGFTHPSGEGGDYTRIKRLLEHLRTRKLNTAPEVIVCKSRRKDAHWTACCFATDGAARIVYCGKAEIVSDEHPMARRVLAQPYDDMPEGADWEFEQRAALPQIESIDAFHFGWRAVRMRLDEARYLFVYLPPRFPDCRYVLHQTADSAKRTWGGMAVWRKLPGFGRFAMGDLYAAVMKTENISGEPTTKKNEVKRNDK